MSRKQLVWLFAGIALILAVVVLYQQYRIQGGSTSRTRSVRQEQLQNSGTTTNIPTSTSGDDQLSGDVQASTGSTIDVVSSNDNCVTSYQALIDRATTLGELGDTDLPQALADIVGLGYCNGSTPKESDFLAITSNGQTISYDDSTSGGVIQFNNTTIVPDFIKNCSSDCPVVQAIRTSRKDNKYVVLETTKPRDYQSSFRLTSTTNGVTMMYWSVLNFVDPITSYAWSQDEHFAFIGSSSNQTKTYVVQPKGFPNSVALSDESDTPIALSWTNDALVVLYDRNPSNTDTSDRYTKSYPISDLQTISTVSGSANSGATIIN